MSKKSFDEIEQSIRTAAAANEPAVDEAAWKKMESLLDKDTDRKRPVVFWLWWLLPLMIGTGILGYFTLSNNANNKINEQPIATQNIDKQKSINTNENLSLIQSSTTKPDEKIINSSSNNITQKIADKYLSHTNPNAPVLAKSKKTLITFGNTNSQTDNDVVVSKKYLNDNVNGKMKATIKPSLPISNEDDTKTLVTENNPEDEKSVEKNTDTSKQALVIQINSHKKSDKEIEKIVDSVVRKVVEDKKSNTKISRLFVIASVGMEASGVKLFSTDKITGRYGLGVGYQINKRLSIQTGFYASSKKYKAGGADYKTKPGTYWDMVNIKNIDANCRVYEIPLSVNYNIISKKNLTIFASAGLSSYLMKREDYHIYYERYGNPYQSEANYKGNNNLFSILKFSAGFEKKINKNFSLIASPGVSIPISGVGEGEVKLFSSDITIGIKYSPFHKK